MRPDEMTKSITKIRIDPMLMLRVWAFFFALTCSLWAEPAITFKKRGELVKAYSLEELDKLMPSSEITVFEPHDKVDETFVGFEVRRLFDAVYGKTWRDWEEVLFRCLDGYEPSVPMDQFRQFESFLVHRRSPSNDFTLHPQDKSENVSPTPLGPFYLIWDNRKHTKLKTEGTSYWPFQVVSVDLIRFSDKFKVMAPPAKSKPQVVRGFLLFRQRCMGCHTMNGEGFKKGVELNFPVNVTEYLSDTWLRRWITNASSIRMNTAMPSFPAKTKDEKKNLDDILAYLKGMAKKKVAN